MNIKTKVIERFIKCFMVFAVFIIAFFVIKNNTFATENEILDYVYVNNKKIDFNDKDRQFIDKKNINIKFKLNNSVDLESVIEKIEETTKIDSNLEENDNLDMEANTDTDLEVEKANVYIELIDNDNLEKQKILFKKNEKDEYEYDINYTFKGTVRICVEKDDIEHTFLIGEVVVETEECVLSCFDLVLANRKIEDVINDYTKLDFFATNSFCGIKYIQVFLEKDGSVLYDNVFDMKANSENETQFNINKTYEDGFVSKIKGEIPIEVEGKIKVFVKVTDNAGYTIKKEKNLIIDKTSPDINIVYENCKGEYSNRDVNCKISILDSNFDEKNTNVYLVEEHNNKLLSLSFEKEDENNYASSFVIDKEGSFTVLVDATDMAKNNKKTESTPICIDKTEPIVTYTYDVKLVKENLLNKKRQLTVKVKDDNFDKELVDINFSSGQPESIDYSCIESENTISIVFNDDGLYKFNINGKDKAGNKFNNNFLDEFVIDTVKPTISIENVENFGAYNKAVNPRIVIEDKNLDDSSIIFYLEKNGMNTTFDYKQEMSKDRIVIEYADITRLKDNDGVYLLKVLCSDLAGNSNENVISFSVNRFGSTYYFNEALIDIKDSYIKNPINFSITEVNVDKIDLTKTYCYLSTDERTRILTPYEDFYVRKDNQGYKNSFTYDFPKSLFNEDGLYSLSIYSEDDAGNINKSIVEDNSGLVSFGIDKTPPIIYGVNVNSNDVLDEKEFIIKAFIKDNIYVRNKEVYINDEPVDFDSKDDEISFCVNESDEAIDIILLAEDLAGNKTKETINNVLVYKEKPINRIKNNIKEKFTKNVSKNNKESYTKKNNYVIPIAISITAIFIISIIFMRYLWKRK